MTEAQEEQNRLKREKTQKTTVYFPEITRATPFIWNREKKEMDHYFTSQRIFGSREKVNKILMMNNCSEEVKEDLESYMQQYFLGEWEDKRKAEKVADPDKPIWDKVLTKFMSESDRTTGLDGDDDKNLNRKRFRD